MPLVIGAGEDEVAVPGQDHVDPLDPRQRDRGVLHAFLVLGRPDAAMAQRDDDVGAFLADLGDIGLGGADDVARLDLALEMLAVPVHDLRRHEADHADPDRMGLAVAGGDLAVEDHVGRHQRLVLDDALALGRHDVGRDDREGGAGDRVHQEVEPVVELVVAERRGVEAERVHRLDHRVHRAFGHAALIGDVVAHRVALQEISIVEQNRVGGLGADVLDQPRGAGEADRVDLLVGVIIIGVDVDVDVRRLHDAQMRLSTLGPDRERVQRQHGRASGEKAAAVQDQCHDRLPAVGVVRPVSCRQGNGFALQGNDLSHLAVAERRRRLRRGGAPRSRAERRSAPPAPRAASRIRAALPPPRPCCG